MAQHHYAAGVSLRRSAHARATHSSSDVPAQDCTMLIKGYLKPFDIDFDTSSERNAASTPFNVT